MLLTLAVALGRPGVPASAPPRHAHFVRQMLGGRPPHAEDPGPSWCRVGASGDPLSLPYGSFPAARRCQSLLSVCLSFCLSICLSLGVCLFVCLSVCLSVFLPVSPSLCPPVFYLSLCLSVSLSLCLFVSLSSCLSVSPSLSLSVFLSLCPFACLSVSLFLGLSVCSLLRFALP